MKSFLGLAVEPVQVKRSLTAVTVFHALEMVARYTAPKAVLKSDRAAWAGSFVGITHHVFTCVYSLKAVLNPTEEMEQDRLYGFSDQATFVVGVSFAYFCWDLSTCARRGIRDPGTLLHALLCAGCYLFGQFPYLNYYGPRFLLFEISSIFMVMRKMMLMVNYQGPAFKKAQTLFGISFFLVRILYGVKISRDFWADTLDLLKSGRQHHTFPVVYYLVANLLLNGLNMFWMSLIIKGYLNLSKVKV